MGHKLFLLFVVLLGVGAIGVAILTSSGALPVRMQVVVSRVASLLQQNSVRPYLQKFEGGWSVVVTPDSSGDAGLCHQTDGAVSIHDGALSGSATMPGTVLSLSAKVAADGSFSGLLGKNTAGSSLSGTLQPPSGQGTWSFDGLGCAGTITFVKIDPIADPVQGAVTAISGGAQIIRNGEAEPLNIGMSLYVGDVVSVQSGTVTLAMGPVVNRIPTTVLIGTTYTVQNTVAY